MTGDSTARELFEIARPFWNYAKRGTPDGGAFERSAQGGMLMRSMEAIAKAIETRSAMTEGHGPKDESAARQGLPKTSLGGSNDR